MKAMILAAGRGERMRPLTDSCPKPLLPVAEKPLLVYHIEKLVAMGVSEIVINHAWLGSKIIEHIGDGSRFGAQMRYSDESSGALETAGGLLNALPLLGDEPFLSINGDIWTDYDFAELPRQLGDNLAHLVLVTNPEHNPNGDFALTGNKVLGDGEIKYTYSGMAVYHPQLFKGLSPGKSALPPLLREKMALDQVSGALHKGRWTDVGTPERLTQLDKQLRGE